MLKKSYLFVILIFLFVFNIQSISAEEYTYEHFTYEVSDNQATILSCDNSVTGSIVIPDKIGNIPVTRIEDGAFYDCTDLTSITIPDGVTYIGDFAFGCCESLTSVKIPDTVSYIGNGAFIYCTSLTSITIPDGVTYIGDFAFESLNITRLSLPNNDYTWVGNYAFSGCGKLEYLYVPAGIDFGYMALRDCNLQILYYDGSYPAPWDYAEFEQARIDLFGEKDIYPGTLYIPKIKVEVSDDGKEFTARLFNDFHVDNSNPIFFAVYNGIQMVDMQIRTNVIDDTVIFKTDKEYTSVKIMSWNIESLQPICKYVTIKR